VFHGDTLKAHTKIISKRESKSRPNQGIVEFEHTMTNQRGEVVASCRRTGLMHCKPKAVSRCDHSCSFPATASASSKTPRRPAADALILDLEDSIAPDEKVGARRTVREMLDARNPNQKIMFASMRSIPT
jgi:hypothetical protein